MPHPLNHKCPIPISLCLTSHFVCVESFHVVNINVPAGVGAPPLNTQVRSGGGEDLGMRLQLEYCTKGNICMAYCDPTLSYCPKHSSLSCFFPQECHGLDTNNIVDGTTIDQFRGCNIITTGGVYIGHISDSAFK